MFKVIVVCSIATGALAPNIHSQTVFEASDGTSSVTLNGGGIALVNFANSSIKVGYNHVVSNRPHRFGAEIEVSADEGHVALREDGEFKSPATQASAFWMYLFEPGAGKVSAHWPAVELSFEQASFDLAEGNGTGEVVESEERFRGWTFTGRYNLLAENLILPGDYVVGVFAGYGTQNNYNSLKKVNVCEEVTTDPTGTLLQSCSSARTGDYLTDEYLRAGADVIWFVRPLKNRIGINIYGRYDEAAELDFFPGIGLFVTEAGAPLRMQGGATAEYIGGEWAINLQVGIPF